MFKKEHHVCNFTQMKATTAQHEQQHRQQSLLTVTSTSNWVKTKAGKTHSIHWTDIYIYTHMDGESFDSNHL